ncbi:hypothetical protein JI435_405820, partial [Parastagonospora nodorum SN15]
PICPSRIMLSLFPFPRMSRQIRLSLIDLAGDSYPLERHFQHASHNFSVWAASARISIISFYYTRTWAEICKFIANIRLRGCVSEAVLKYPFQVCITTRLGWASISASLHFAGNKWLFVLFA